MSHCHPVGDRSVSRLHWLHRIPAHPSPHTHPAPLSCRPSLFEVRLRPRPSTSISAATAVSPPTTAIFQQFYHLGLASRVQALRKGQGA